MIRPYQKEDADVLTNVWLEASLHAHGFVDRRYWDSKAEEIRSVWLPSARTLVWEESGVAVAFVSLLEDEYIGALFVSPAFQNQGIGSKLLAFLQQELSRLRLQVFTKNISAVSFYQRHGFAEEKRQTDADTGEEELLMLWQQPSEKK